jgi:hypothetical protein
MARYKVLLKDGRSVLANAEPEEIPSLKDLSATAAMVKIGDLTVRSSEVVAIQPLDPKGFE